MAFAAWLVLVVCVGAALSDDPIPIPCDTPDTTKSTCNCNGTLFDLSTMANTDGTKLFSGKNGDYMYFFQMNGLPPSSTGCTFDPALSTGNAGGQGTLDGTTCYPIGLVSEQTWSLIPATPATPQVVLVAFGGGQEGRTTSLKAICDSTTKGKFSAKGETSQGSMIYEVDILTSAACTSGTGPTGSPTVGPGGDSSSSSSLDVGWILFIVFICSLFSYFVGGMVFMKYRRQASGREMVPNVEFWSSLPGLVKDGFLFSIAKIRRTEYQPL